VIVFYLPVIMGSLLWLYQVGQEWLVWARLVGDRPLLDAAVGLVVGVGLVVASRFGERTGPGARAASVLAHHMGRVTWPGLLAVGCTSALGEELLFRGVLQPTLGLTVAAILFAAAHVPFREELWPWTVQALLHGLLFGVAYDRSDALVVPIVGHAVFNVVQLVRWKRLAHP
jgi:membrane protease YdiL (CAAX protease family)